MTTVPETDITALLRELATLLTEYHELAASYDTQIHQLEVARADATAHLTFQIDTLKSVIRPAILAEQRSMKIEGVTAIYTHKETWDHAGLLAFAEEVPTVKQFLKDASYVSFRTRKDAHGLAGRTTPSV